MIDLMSQPARKATAAELAAAFGEDSRVEIIHGEMLEKAAPRMAHSAAAGKLTTCITRRFGRAPGGKWPGGWWIRPELHVQYETHEVFCHDLCGYRRDMHVEIPRSWPVKVRPDWVCELLSPSHEKRDVVDKWNVLFRTKVPHYWIVNPEEKSLHVYRWEHDGYKCVLAAASGDVIRAEPFDAVELRASVLFDDEDDDE